jgi:hypothetical protein
MHEGAKVNLKLIINNLDMAKKCKNTQKYNCIKYTKTDPLQ